MQKALALGLGLVLAAAVAAPAMAQDPDEYTGDPYTLGTCPVSGEELGAMGPPQLLNQDGRDIRFCCAGCPPRFKADTAKYIGEIDAKMIADQKPHYPLDTDVVSGDPLPSDDQVIDLVYFNRLVRLGSQKSAQKFFRDPQAYLAKLDEAVIKAQQDSYPMTVCVVSGDELGAMGGAIQKVYANRLVQFCCPSCVTKFWEEPHKYLSMIEKGEAPEGSGHHGDSAEHEDHDHSEHMHNDDSGTS